MKQYLCVGSYTEPILFGTGELFQGKGKGVSIYAFEEGRLTLIQEIAVKNPSFVCLNEEHRKIYAVNESKEFNGEFGGGITQLVYDDAGVMTWESAYPTAGTDPCHVAMTLDQKFLSVANFSSGAVTVYPLDEDGNIVGGKRHVFQHEGAGAHPVRQKGPHAHSSIFTPDGAWMLVPDLGTDRLEAYRLDGDSIHPDAGGTVAVPAGSGPRYGEFSPNGQHFYLINELASRVMHYRWENGKLCQCEAVGTLPDGYAGESICSDLHITPDGRYLYASNRGHDSIVCFAIAPDGSLSFQSRQACGGKTPRNFAIDPLGQYLLAGNQDSDNITVFRICDNGGLKQVEQIELGSPVCIRFFEHEIFGSI